MKIRQLTEQNFVNRNPFTFSLASTTEISGIGTSSTDYATGSLCNANFEVLRCGKTIILRSNRSSTSQELADLQNSYFTGLAVETR